MGISYKNGSGCPDPTAYYAVQHMEAEEKRLHIRYPTGQMVLEIERFFPCTVAKAKKLSPLLRRYCEKSEKEKLRQFLTKQEMNYRSRIKAYQNRKKKTEDESEKRGTAALYPGVETDAAEDKKKHGNLDRGGNRMIRLSIGNSRMEKHWNLVEMELSEFRERISHTRRTAETVEQYRKLGKAKQDEIKDVGGFVLGTLKGGRRKKDCVLTRSGLSLDMDYATEDIIDQIEMFFSFQCYVYSTHKHTPEKPRLRLIIPLSREVTPDEYCAVSRKVAEEIGLNFSMIPPMNRAG